MCEGNATRNVGGPANLNRTVELRIGLALCTLACLGLISTCTLVSIPSVRERALLYSFYLQPELYQQAACDNDGSSGFNQCWEPFFRTAPKYYVCWHTVLERGTCGQLDYPGTPQQEACMEAVSRMCDLMYPDYGTE